jgi:dipeptidyl aminopeptidase/acylaminoacyl peptidase
MRNIGILAVVSAMATFAVAQTPTIDQSLEAKQPQSVEISPDGRSVAYTVQYTNWDENSFDEQIWIAKTASGEKYPLTGGKKSSQSPQWSYDSRRIAFKSDRDGKSQIYVIAPAGGEAVALTNEDNGVGSFAWSPDGNWIAFTSTGPESKPTKDRKEKYGDFEVVTGDYTMNHLWLVKVPEDIPLDAKQKPKPEALTKGDNVQRGCLFLVARFQAHRL